MSDRNAFVYDDELAAIKDSRQRDLTVFVVASDTKGKSHWIVAASEHQAKLALIDRVWPMQKHTKRSRDERYTQLLEEQIELKQPSVPQEEGGN